MKVSINWLKEYVDFDCPLDELAAQLTMAGLEVEETRCLTKSDFVEAGGSGTHDDTVWDVKVTPNRGDWLSMIGVARECAALVGTKAKVPVPDAEGVDPPSSDSIRISIADPDLCGRYVGVVVRNVKIRQSPDWMKDRLIAAGMRPINNVVDVTNYVMLELGQPLHAFDLSLLHDSRIIVRRAKSKETITSLDGMERKLQPDMLVIADCDRAVAIAGVMGGADSEIGEQTQDILIESANFNSVSIRRTAKRLDMVTESSYRFERSVDPSVTVVAALRAAELIRELTGGEIGNGVVDVHPGPVEPLEIDARPERVNSVLGTSLTADQMMVCLNSYEIETVFDGCLLRSKVPTFRSDVTREIDLVEEIGRSYGYDRLGTTLPAKSYQGRDCREGAFRSRLRHILMACGAQEALTHSLVDGKLADLAGESSKRVMVRNPLSEELDSMRVRLISNLLQVLRRNQVVGTPDLSVFEIGKVYFVDESGVVDEKLSLAGAMVGSQWRSSWALPENALDADFFFCKGMIESVLTALGVTGVVYERASHPLLHKTRSARIVVSGVELGMLGEASPEVLRALDIKERACVFELDFAVLMESTPEIRKCTELPRYPALNRHIAVVVSDNVDYQAVLDIVYKPGGDILEQVDLLDLYKGEHIAADQRSLTLSLSFRSRERTLTDEEVTARLDCIKEALRLEVGASFR